MSISPQTIGVIPPFGAYTSEWSQPTSEDQNLARLYPHGYMLSVGNIEPRKNHLGLIRAYAWAQARHSPSQEVSPSGLSRAFPHLVLVGNEAWDGGVTRKEVERLGLKAQITFTGHISDASLGAHLRQSLLFVTASLYEGFGMPLFEALCLGKACIYHAGTAHDSFANGAALAVDCQKPEVLGAAMTRLSLDATWRGEIEIKAKQRSQDLLSHDLPAALRNVLLAAKEV